MAKFIPTFATDPLSALELAIMSVRSNFISRIFNLLFEVFLNTSQFLNTSLILYVPIYVMLKFGRLLRPPTSLQTIESFSSLVQ